MLVKDLVLTKLELNSNFIVMVALQNLHELAGFQGQGAGGLGLVQKGSCNYWKQYQYQ